MDQLEHRLSQESSKFGENVDVTISLRRHAEKSMAGTLVETTSAEAVLSEKGEADAKNLGTSLGAEHNGVVKVYHSQVDRAEKTGQNIAAQNNAYAPRPKPSLDFRNFILKSTGAELARKLHEAGKEETDLIQAFIDTDDTPIDSLGKSSNDISRALASEILHVCAMSKKMRSGSHAHIEFISHSGMIEHLLKNVLKKEAAHFIDKEMDGVPFEYLEDMKFTIHRRTKNEASILVEFRGKRIDISEDELRSLAGAQ